MTAAKIFSQMNNRRVGDKKVLRKYEKHSKKRSTSY
jgi:hypothetical protein